MILRFTDEESTREQELTILLVFETCFPFNLLGVFPVISCSWQIFNKQTSSLFLWNGVVVETENRLGELQEAAPYRLHHHLYHHPYTTTYRL